MKVVIYLPTFQDLTGKLQERASGIRFLPCLYTYKAKGTWDFNSYYRDWSSNHVL